MNSKIVCDFGYENNNTIIFKEGELDENIYIGKSDKSNE